MSRVTAALILSTLFCVTQFETVVAQESGLAIPATDAGLPGDGPIRRYDWFKKLWLNKRSGWAKRVEADQNALVFLGDSITQGWGDNFGNSFPGVKVANRGISGDTTRGMLVRLQQDVLSLKPAGVVMLMGTNDLEEAATPATIAANLKLIVGELKKHNADMPIVLCNVFPSSASKKRSAADIQEVNGLYFEAVKGDPQVTVLDTWTLFANESGDAKKAEFPDLLHPNKIGYAKWAAALRPVLATLGFVDQEPDSFVIEDGFRSIFNGKDLTGWGFRKTPERMKKNRAKWKNRPTWPIVEKDVTFDGKTSTPDGRYVVKNGRLVVTTPPEGRRIQQLWTTEKFGEDFVLKLEFRATPNADSGVFIRQPQLQCRDYALAGPFRELKNYRPQGWNELVVNVKGGSAHCTCNGEVLNANFKVPETGSIGLEGDRGQVEYRRIRIGKDTGNLLRTTNSAAAWNFETHEGGKGTIKSDGDSIIFQTSATTGTEWHVQAYQAGLTLEEGADYTVRFQLKSPNQSVLALMGMIHQPDWTPIGLHQEIYAEKDFSDYEFSFTATDVADGPNNRIGFQLGMEKGTVVVRNLSLTKD